MELTVECAGHASGLAGQVCCGEQLGHPLQRVEWVAQLVADRGHHPAAQLGLGHRVVTALAQLGDQLVVGGDVARRDDDAADLGVVDQVHRVHLEGLDGVLGAAHVDLGAQHQARLSEHLVAHGHHPLDVVGDHDVEDAALCPELERVAHDRLVPARGLDDATIAVDERDRVVDVLDELAQAALTQRLALDDGRDRPEQTDALAVVAQCGHLDPGQQRVAVLAHQCLLGREVVDVARSQSLEVVRGPGAVLALGDACHVERAHLVHLVAEQRGIGGVAHDLTPVRRQQRQSDRRLFDHRPPEGVARGVGRVHGSHLARIIPVIGQDRVGLE